MKKVNIWSWIILAIGIIYFFLPLISTFEFSLKMIKDQYTFEAYRIALTDKAFFEHFGYSVLWAVLTIFGSTLLVVPTAYWVHWKLPKARPYVEFVTLMPFVVQMSGLIYLSGAIALGIGFLYYAIRLYREEQPNTIAMKTFGYSIFYLSLLFAFLLADHYARVFIRGWFL